MDDQRTDTPKGNILVVDDTAHVRLLLSQMLTKQGYEVQAVDGGAEALAAVQSALPDLILLDIMMPEMNGYEVCERLKADARTRDIPIIFISALEQTEDKVKAFTVGGVDYVTKPFQVKEVLARVSAHMSLRALQKQLRAASDELAAQLEELQARNEELDAFARAVARDLKIPLTSIIGFADMLESIHATLPDEQLRESLRTIASNGHKMNKIIDELLLLAGLRQAEQVDIKPLDMASIVNAALRRLADMIEGYQADIVLPASWPTALGHGPWVEEVWVNYISNAIEYGGRPPRVELGAAPHSIPPDGGEEGGRTVRFWVRDNSPGLASKHRDQMPADAEERGLGLIVVRRIMEKLGRKASVESTDGQGNIYSFTLRSA